MFNVLKGGANRAMKSILVLNQREYIAKSDLDAAISPEAREHGNRGLQDGLNDCRAGIFTGHCNEGGTS